MIKNIDDIKKMKLHEMEGWKFGLCTREISRIDENRYCIDDTSDGWKSAYVTLEQLEQLFNGDLSLTDLNWE